MKPKLFKPPMKSPLYNPEALHSNRTKDRFTSIMNEAHELTEIQKHVLIVSLGGRIDNDLEGAEDWTISHPCSDAQFSTSSCYK